MMTLARKIAGALGVGLVGWILTGVGYVPQRPAGDQTSDVLLAVRLIMGLAIVVFIAIALWASFNYKITNKKLTRVRYFIEARKAGTVLSEEEEAERTALVHELYGKEDPGGYVPVLAGADGTEMSADTPEASFGEAEGEVFEESAISSEKGEDAAEHSVPEEESAAPETSEDEEK